MPLRLAIAGCTGRTGRAVLNLAARDLELQVVAALTVADDPALGRDAGLTVGLDEIGISITEHCNVECDVVVEFTLPPGCRAWAEWCADHRVALVSGTTGLTEPELAALRAVAERVPVVWAPNMSIGANLLLQLVADAAKRLDPTWEVEICETHHRQKLDAPSGTARALYQAVCAARGCDPLDAATYGRYGRCGPRPAGEIGIHALRLGSSMGEHEVHFAAAGETLTLRHQAQSRDIFATGALRAARWIVGRPPSLYNMRDVLAGQPPAP
jgi:4-hydroxy-tetrahydrodipicolinate reductase